MSIYISRENDSFFETTNIEKIFSEENTSGKEIKSLSLDIVTKNEEVNSSKKKEKAIIAFNGSSEKDVKINIITTYKSRDWCLLLIDELDGQVKRILKGKAVSLTKAKILDFIFALALFSVLLIGIAWDANKPQIDTAQILSKSLEEKINFLVEQSTSNKSNKVLWYLPGMTFVMLSLILIIELKPITRIVRSSNISAFYWGDATQKYDAYVDKREKIKWGVIIAFVVSVAASVVAAWLF